MEESASAPEKSWSSQNNMTTDITWSAGQEIVMVHNVSIRSEETMTRVPLSFSDETDPGDSYTIQAVEQGVGVSTDKLFGKIGEDQWIKLKDKS